MISRALLAFALAAAACPAAALAQSEASGETTPEAPPRPCSSEAHRQFDFWVGEWDVHRASGGPAARNSITALHGGCVIRESYTNPSGYSGMSLNYYDEADGRWHQLWLDNQGLVLELEGGWNGKSMVLANGESRITWTPADDGSVRQVWEQTEDGGKTWKAVFDGTYVRRAGS